MLVAALLLVGSVLALSMMVLGYLNVEADLPMGVAIGGALAASILAGAASGVCETRIWLAADTAHHPLRSLRCRGSTIGASATS